ncbi:matrixin family metalloprotease [Pseudoduganella sp. OTU4001]|uniref:matrixin family metalloprotease n=1 Tax=Pseudoduganella sp. OTU4001 TaxID=3043854 RepID=UPI00313C14BA
MATVSQVRSTTLSGLNYIDSLLGNLPNWNYQTGTVNTLYYTFSVASGLETGNSSILSAPKAFTAAQQAATRGAMAYAAKLTGINFVETTDGSAAQFHFANANISGAYTTGLDSSRYSYSYNSAGTVTKFTAATYVYLDNAEWATKNANLTPGTQGYETLLHEIGHALGLKHSFEGTIKLPTALDNTSHTLMSYTHSGGFHSTFSEYDVAALKWLYGGDGLAGALGVNSTTGARYLAGTSVADTLTGTAFNDKLEGNGGNDVLNGGAGNDIAVYNGLSTAYTLLRTGASTWQVSGAEGVDLLSNIEMLQFTDRSVALTTTTTTATATSAATTTTTAYAAGTGVVGTAARMESDAPMDDLVQLVGHRGHQLHHLDHSLV